MDFSRAELVSGNARVRLSQQQQQPVPKNNINNITKIKRLRVLSASIIIIIIWQVYEMYGLHYTMVCRILFPRQTGNAYISPTGDRQNSPVARARVSYCFFFSLFCTFYFFLFFYLLSHFPTYRHTIASSHGL